MSRDMAANSDIGSLQNSMRNKSIRSRSSHDTYGRVSVRSKGSSTSSEDRTKVFRNCCRALVEFVFTQVGVGGLVVCYTIVGAFAFQAIETVESQDLIQEVTNKRQEAVRQLWNITNTFNTLNRRLWNEMTQDVILNYQTDMTDFIKEGYDEQTAKERWTFASALMFTLSVITMIGYGNIVPRSDWGKITTMLYALFGIPVYILYFMNMGKVFANVFKWVYRKTYYWALRRKQSPKYDMMDSLEEEKEVMVPSTACVWVMLAYLATGTVMFAEWEGWNYLDSVYFCVTSLLKIGIGDFVPGQSASGQGKGGEENHAKLYINFFYILLGMGVVAMNYYLLREEVLLRVDQLKKKMRQSCCRSRDPTQ